MAQPILTEANLRLFLMDRPQYNTLIDGVMWTPEMINQAMIACVDFFNISNPPANVFVSVETFPSIYMLTVGVSGYLLKSSSINQAVNNLEYSADGVSINDRNKSQIFAELGNSLWAEYKEMVMNLKTNQNISACYSTVFSEWITRNYN